MNKLTEEQIKDTLAEIKERRAVIARASPGPWDVGAATYQVVTDEKLVCKMTTNTVHERDADAAFIAASRNERDTELQALETAIKVLLQVGFICPNVNSLESFNGRNARSALTTLCDKLEAGRHINKNKIDANASLRRFEAQCDYGGPEIK